MLLVVLSLHASIFILPRGGNQRKGLTFLVKPLVEQLLRDVRAVKKPAHFQDGGRHHVSPSYLKIGDVKRGGHAVRYRGPLFMRRYHLEMLPAVEEPHVSPDSPGLVMRHGCASQRDGRRARSVLIVT